MEVNPTVENALDNILASTEDNGAIESVHVAPIGEFYGSDLSGNAVKENVTVEALEEIASKANEGDEILCDVDHNASKIEQRDTQAAGWFSKFIVDPIKGLFAKLKLTKSGAELIKNREYRYVSPVFVLGKDNKPIELKAISLTNAPAFKGAINPILNSEPIDFEDLMLKEIDMTKEDLKKMVDEAIDAKLAKNAESLDEENEGEPSTKSESESEVQNEPDEAKNECGETKTEEAKNETVVAKEANGEKEVIKIETLNSAPLSNVQVDNEEWKNLHGEEFFKWLAAHPEVK